MEAEDTGSAVPSKDASIDDLVTLVKRSADGRAVAIAVDQLVDLARNGSRPAMSALLRTIVDLRWAERPVRAVLMDQADIDDAVQTTLIAVASKLEGFEGRSSFRAWVDRIARNEALMLIRSRGRRAAPAGDALPEADRSVRRLSSLVASEQAYAQLLAELSPEHQIVIQLREAEGLSYEQIAAQLDVPVGTVRSRINRARRHLADQLLDLARKEGC